MKNARALPPLFMLPMLVFTMSGSAWAHGGLPAEAILVDPNEIAVWDQSIELLWIDSDNPIPTGTATVNLFYTADMPPTFEPGTHPDALVGTPILEGRAEYDPNNTFVWDTSQIPAGTYWVWSKVIEPPEKMQSPQIIHFTQAPLVVAHPGDEVPPAIRITNPDNPFVWADQEFSFEYEAFDPSGTAKVKLEASDQFDGTGFFTVAEDLPAVADGVFVWDVSELAQIDWTLRATITDDRGFSITAYAQHFLLITHLQDVDAGIAEMDSGVGPPPSDLGTRDAGVQAPDMGKVKLPAEDDGCTCVQIPKRAGAGESGSALVCFALFGLLLVFKRRS